MRHLGQATGALTERDTTHIASNILRLGLPWGGPRAPGFKSTSRSLRFNPRVKILESELGYTQEASERFVAYQGADA